MHTSVAVLIAACVHTVWAADAGGPGSCAGGGKDETCSLPSELSGEAWRSLYAEDGWRFNNSACAMPGALEGSVTGAILYTWGELLGGLPAQRESDVIRLHMLGASFSYEGRANWDFLLRFLPAQVKLLEVTLVLGPEPSRNEKDNVPEQESARCPQPRKDQPRLKIICQEVFYHTAIVERGFKAPDFAVMVNPGIGQDDRWTWEASIQWLLRRQIPFMVLGSELDRWKTLHTFVEKVVDGVAPPIPVVEEALRGGSPLHLQASEVWSAFDYFTRVGARVRNISINPFRYPGAYLPKCPPDESEAEVLRRTHEASARKTWEILKRNGEHSWRKLSRHMWATWPPKSLDDMCFSWMDVEASAYPPVKSAMILLVEGFVPGGSLCEDCVMPEDPALRAIKHIHEAYVEYTTSDSDQEEEQIDMEKLRVLGVDDEEVANIPVSERYVETYLAFQRHMFNVTVPPFKPECSNKFSSLSRTERKKVIADIQFAVWNLVDQIEIRT